MRKALIILLLAVNAYGQRTGQRNIVELQTFTGGKVSPKLEGRQDYPKYISALRKCDNFLVNTLGPVQRRPGTRYVATAKTGTPRLLIFEYSTDDVYIIEMGDEYMRFYRNGGQILSGVDAYEISTPFDSSELSSVRYAQSGNWMYLVDGNDMPQVLTRTAHDAWTISDILQEGGPFLNENTNENLTITPSATSGNGITLTASGGLFDSDDIGSLWQIGHAVEAETIDGRFWGPWGDVSDGGTGDSNSVDTITVFQGQTYTVTTGGDWWGTFAIERSYDSGVTWLNVKSFAASGNKNILYNGIEIEADALYRLTIRGQTVTSHMHRHGEGECDYSLATNTFTKYGIVEIATVASAVSATANVDADFPLASTDATYRWSETMWSDFKGWPKTVTFHQQRTIYGGSRSYPTALWFSQTGADYYDDFTVGTLDTDAFWVDLQGQNPIRWLRSGDYLLVGTSGSVGRYGKQGLSITPTSPSYLEQSQNGAAAIQSIMAGDMVIYVERNQRRIREFGYNFQFDRYTTPDLTLLSEEITDPCVVEIAFQGQPQPTVWCVLGDGDIATMTYERNQTVAAWAKQNTAGEFKSIAITPSSGLTPAGDAWTEDSVWVVVEREVNDVNTSFIEQFTPVDWGNDNDYVWFVDGGIGGTTDNQGAATYTGAAAYPTLQELTAAEIPSKPSERADTAQAGATAVTNKTELQAMHDANDYYLSNDIDAAGAWTPIVGYSGVLDGNDFTISNLTINAGTSDNQGMFASFATGAEVRSLTFKDGYVVADDWSAILVGGCSGVDTVKISDVHFVDCYVEGDDRLGCAAGRIFQGEGWQFWRCSVSGNTTTTGTGRAGNLIGDLVSPSGDVTINMVVDCNTTSTGFVQGDDAGGLIGGCDGGAVATDDETIIHTCFATVEIQRSTSNDIGSGGFTGNTSACHFTNCYATGDIVSTVGADDTVSVGGFAVQDEGYNRYVNCYATGDVQVYGGSMLRVAGFIAKVDPVKSYYLHCYSTGDVTLLDNGFGNFNYYGVGGFFGAVHQAVLPYPDNGLVERCWSTSDVTVEFGADAEGTYGGAGGFIGNMLQIPPTIRDCYAWGSVIASDGEVKNGFGGFIGAIADQAGGTVDADANMVNCYCAQTDIAVGSGYTDQITDDPNSGGFSGYVSNAGGYELNDVNDGNIVCFWDTETSGLSSSISGTGHVTSWMQTQSNYEAVGWNFDTIWFMPEPSTWEGFDHWASTEGIEVCVVADGNSIGTYTIDANGVLDIGDGYTVIIAGLNYWSKLETMPLIVPEGRLNDKQITRINIDLLEGTYLEYSMGEDSVIEDADIVTIADFNSVTTSTRDFKRMAFPYGSRKKPTVYIQTFEPVPLGIRAIISEVTSYPPR